jgi:hypothetical protein
MAVWVIGSGDNGDLPFVIIDKDAAKVFVFDPDGRLLGATTALVGFARGDDTAEGVGDAPLSAITPEERTTPAGRFLAGFGPSTGAKTVLWVDYAAAISLHPVVTSNPREHRLQRLKSSNPDDHRISYGCINVPADFYDQVVLEAFARGSGVVYILPDTRPVEEIFPTFAAMAWPHGPPRWLHQDSDDPDARRIASTGPVLADPDAAEEPASADLAGRLTAALERLAAREDAADGSLDDRRARPADGADPEDGADIVRAAGRDTARGR